MQKRLFGVMECWNNGKNRSIPILHYSNFSRAAQRNLVSHFTQFEDEKMLLTSIIFLTFFLES